MTERLVEQARRGDPDAFVALIEERQEAMTRIATAILGEPADVADALQETLVAMWRHLPSIRSVDAYPAWADRVLVNSCRLVLRRRARRGVREVPIAADDLRPSTVASPAGDEIVNRDAFDRAFGTLNADERSIIVLHHLEGRPLAQIAATLGIPVGTAKSRLFHARRRLEIALLREGARGLDDAPADESAR